MKDEEKPVYAVLVKDFVEFSKWLKSAIDKDVIVYRPVFSMNSAVGVRFDAMIVTRDFWKTKDAGQIHAYVQTRVLDRLKESQRVDASDGILKKRFTEFLERAFRSLWR